MLKVFCCRLFAPYRVAAEKIGAACFCNQFGCISRCMRFIWHSFAFILLVLGPFSIGLVCWCNVNFYRSIFQVAHIKLCACIKPNTLADLFLCQPACLPVSLNRNNHTLFELQRQWKFNKHDLLHQMICSPKTFIILLISSAYGARTARRKNTHTKQDMNGDKQEKPNKTNDKIPFCITHNYSPLIYNLFVEWSAFFVRVRLCILKQQYARARTHHSIAFVSFCLRSMNFLIMQWQRNSVLFTRCSVWDDWDARRCYPVHDSSRKGATVYLECDFSLKQTVAVVFGRIQVVLFRGAFFKIEVERDYWFQFYRNSFIFGYCFFFSIPLSLATKIIVSMR